MNAQRRRNLPRALVAAVAAAGFLSTGGTALAQATGTEFEDYSALWQYQESIPTSGGAVPGGGGGGGSDGPGAGTGPGPTALPRDVREELSRSGGSDAQMLEQLATSPALGAPERPRRGGKAGKAGAAGGAAPLAEAPRAQPTDRSPLPTLSGAVRALEEGGGTNLPLLVAVLVLVTAGAGAAAAARRRGAAA